MTDRDIMIFAKEKMNETANNMMKNDLSESGVKEWFAMRYMDKAYIGKEKVGEDTYAMSLDRLDRASGTNQGFEMVRDHSRVVMEASMNNLIYNGKFMEKQDDFLVHVAKHIKEYKDEKVANALHAATSSGIFNQAAFAKEMGFKIDYAAANRKDENSEILTQFFMDKSGKDAFAGYDLETIAQNKNPSVISRYANDSKELTQGRNSYIPHIR
jgi:hypothetical protein